MCAAGGNGRRQRESSHGREYAERQRAAFRSVRTYEAGVVWACLPIIWFCFTADN